MLSLSWPRLSIGSCKFRGHIGWSEDDLPESRDLEGSYLSCSLAALRDALRNLKAQLGGRGTPCFDMQSWGANAGSSTRCKGQLQFTAMPLKLT